MAKRRKAEVLPAAQTREEAIALLGRYAEIDGQIAERAASLARTIADLKAGTDLWNAPLEAEQKAIFLQLKPWWAVSRDELTEGKRKSLELGGCLIGERLSNPALVYPKPEENAVSILELAGFKACLRVKTSLDKEWLIRFLRTNFDGGDGDVLNDQDQQQLIKLGFGVSQKEEFFIDRLPPREPAVEVVADPQAEQVAA